MLAYRLCRKWQLEVRQLISGFYDGILQTTWELDERSDKWDDYYSRSAGCPSETYAFVSVADGLPRKQTRISDADSTRSFQLLTQGGECELHRRLTTAEMINGLFKHGWLVFSLN